MTSHALPAQPVTEEVRWALLLSSLQARVANDNIPEQDRVAEAMREEK